MFSYLLRLCELELIERERRMIERRDKSGKVPGHQEPRQLRLQGRFHRLNKTLTIELARCEFIDQPCTM